MMVSNSSMLDAHNVHVLGSGDDVTVVLSHGFGGDQSMWKNVVPSLLARDFRVVLYDMMGAGTTNTTDFSFGRYSSLHAYADDLLSILDELDVESCVFVGHSVSGMVGCLASIERPEVFQKLILLAASPRYLNDTDYNGGFAQSDLDQIFTSIKSNFRGWVSAFAPAVLGGDADPGAMQCFSRSLFSLRPDVALSVAQTIFQSDHRSVLPQVTVPCYIVQTLKDMAVSVEVAKYMSRSLGGRSSVEILETEGHLPQLTCPEVVVPVLLRCIEDA